MITGLMPEEMNIRQMTTAVVQMQLNAYAHYEIEAHHENAQPLFHPYEDTMNSI
jgi:hypothetical protein